MRRHLARLATMVLSLAGLLLPLAGWDAMLATPKPWVLAAVGVLGVLLQPAYDPKDATATDSGTAVALTLAISAYTLGTLVDARLRAGDDAVLWDALTWAALGLMLAGLALRTWAIRTLGRFFTLHVGVAAQQTVIRTGPYRWMRHPSYVGALLLFAGMALFLRAWLAATFGLALLAVFFVRRVRVEERVLVAKLGDAYREYQRATLF